MKTSFDARLLCRCSECNTVFRLAVNQIASRGGLVRCGDCGAVFNAAWNLVDEIPNPVKLSNPVAPIPSIGHGREKIFVEYSGPENESPGFEGNKHFFSLDDQLRQDLQSEADDPGALEEIRRTLGPTDPLPQPNERGTRSAHNMDQVGGGNTARRARSEPRTTEPPPLNPGSQPKIRRRLAGKSSPAQRVRTQGLWLLAALMMATGIFMQTRYWLFDELAAIPSARLPLESFCRLADCTVPAPLMGPAFRALETRVDLDPQLPGAVIVKVHIANRTTAPRPYPAIQLTLTDREGRTIGKRTYTAGDYATMANADELPANAVAIISLHLAGPDENAVGFEAKIVNTGT